MYRYKRMSVNSNITNISIIIPVYNEERRIAQCLERSLDHCRKKGWNFEIIVAEDGSTDGTVRTIGHFQSIDNRIKLISFKERLGKGGATRNAAFVAKKEYVGYMDVDLSADISEFDRLLEYIENSDLVMGSRILRGDLPPIQRPLYRSVFSYLYSKFFRTLFRSPIYDPQCGFKLFRKDIIPVLFKEINTTGFAFDSELVVKAICLGLRVKEIPIVWNHHAASKISVLHQMREMQRDLLSIWYEAHMLWLQNRTVYPQKKGSLRARLLFSILSLNKKPRMTPSAESSLKTEEHIWLH
jgi:glycosyltransferase AglD